jgi:AraC family transcriptional regulator of adaptative response / DNA-3-methyladenine glycosylase II
VTLSRYLGAAFDLDAFYEFAHDDPVLARLVAALRGFRPPVALDPFESLVTSITAQQVSLFSAFAIRNRLVARYGARAEHAHAFPDQTTLARASEEELYALGFSRRKAEYVVGLAQSELDLDALAELPDDEVAARLTAIRGVGEWTAQYIALRALRETDAFPATDVGLLRGATRGASPRPTPADLLQRAEPWRPWRAYAAQHLWAADAGRGQSAREVRRG